MTLPDLSDLDDADRGTVALLHREFAALRLDRPTPVLPSARPPGEPVRRRAALLAGSGVAAAGVAVALVIGGGVAHPDPVWAATPVDRVSVDPATAASRCGEMLAQAFPDKEREAAGSDLPGADLTSAAHLVMVDERGRGALAVFDDGRWTAECVLLRTNGGWAASGQAVTPHQSVRAGSASAQPVIIEDGDEVVLVSGQAPEGADAVHVTVADGTDAVATLEAGRFALWLPAELARPAMTLSAVTDGSTHAFAQVTLPETKR